MNIGKDPAREKSLSAQAADPFPTGIRQVGEALRRAAGWALGFTPSWIARWIPCGSPAGKFPRTLLNPLLPSGLSWARIAAGPARCIWLRLNLQDEKGYVTGGREEVFQDALLNQLEPGTRFWDVGARGVSPFSGVGASKAMAS